VSRGQLREAGIVDLGQASAQRKKRGEADAAAGARVEQGGVSALGHVEAVLHRRDGGDRAGLFELSEVDIAQAEVADQTLFTQPGQGLEALGDGLAVRHFHPANAQVDQIETVHAQGLEVLLDGRAQTGGWQLPVTVRAEDRPHLGRDHQLGWIRVERVADQRVRPNGTVAALVESGRVDVVHA
jgi:hypothetical protein